MLDAIKGSNASRGIRFKLMNTIVICNPLILIVTDVCRLPQIVQTEVWRLKLTMTNVEPKVTKI
jgi:hypothetical protein